MQHPTHRAHGPGHGTRTEGGCLNEFFSFGLHTIHGTRFVPRSELGSFEETNDVEEAVEEPGGPMKRSLSRPKRERERPLETCVNLSTLVFYSSNLQKVHSCELLFSILGENPQPVPEVDSLPHRACACALLRETAPI